MARNFIFRCYCIGARRVKYMVDMLPADASPLDDPEIVLWPDGAISIDEPGDVGYKDDFPVGFPNASSWKITAHLWRMVGSTDITNGRQWLVAFKRSAIGVVSVGGQHFDVSNVWRIYSDEGRGDEVYTLKYEGVQWVDPSPDMVIQIAKGGSVKYELQDLAATTLRLATMEMVCSVHNGIAKTGDWADFYSEVIDDMWIGAGSNHTSVFCDVNDHHVGLTPMTKIMLAAQRVCDDIYRRHVRLDGGWQTDGNYKYIFDSLQVTDHRTDPATPMDYIGFNEIDETTAGDPGDPIDREAWGVMDVISTLGGTEIGGLTRPGKDSLQSFGTMLDCLEPFFETGICRAMIDRSTVGIIHLRFLPAILPTGSEYDVNLTLDDILVERDKVAINPKLHASMIMQQEWGARDPRGDDQDSWKYPEEADDTARKFGSRLMLSTDATLGDFKWFYQDNPNDYSAGGGASLRMDQYFPWKIYYMAHPWGQLDPVPCRVHHQVRYPVGFPTEQLWGTNTPLPTALPITSTRLPLRAVVAVNQALGGLQAAVMGGYDTFNDQAQVVYPITVPFPLRDGTPVDTRNVGSAVNLPADVHGDLTINSLLESGADYVDGNGACVVVRAKPNIEKSTVALTLLGRGQ